MNDEARAESRAMKSTHFPSPLCKLSVGQTMYKKDHSYNLLQMLETPT